MNFLLYSALIARLIKVSIGSGSKITLLLYEKWTKQYPYAVVHVPYNVVDVPMITGWFTMKYPALAISTKWHAVLPQHGCSPTATYT